MKMALQYWHSMGTPRQRFLTFRHGYHGDTFGAMSVCDPDNSMHSLWKGYLPENLFAPAPQVKVVSAVGAGDTFVGAYVLALSQGAPRDSALAYAVAAAAAACITPATELCHPADVARLLPLATPVALAGG